LQQPLTEKIAMNAKKVRILVADDHDVVRLGVRALLEQRPEWEVCGEAVTGPDAVEKTKRLAPDVVVLDANMPQLPGAEATRQILQAVPGCEVLILTVDESPELMRDILRAGAHGYVFKSDLSTDLVSAVQALSQHGQFFTSKVAQMMYEDYVKRKTPARGAESGRPLTARQREVLRLLAEGKSNKEVASALGISVKTAETHRAKVMRNLQLSSFSELVRYAVRCGITKL
jgi:two-component system, NarL family, response regulator NreC